MSAMSTETVMSWTLLNYSQSQITELISSHCAVAWMTLNEPDVLSNLKADLDD